MLVTDQSCHNSDGFIGYSFSHEGYFSGGTYQRIYSADTAKECSAECTSSGSSCVAFQFRDDYYKSCWTYSDTGTGIRTVAGDLAYVKCIGNEHII